MAATHKPLLGPCDSYQLEPFAYEWAWTMARAQENNNWAPEEIAVATDVADYRDPSLDPRHKHLFESVMAQLTTFDIERGDDAAETFLSVFQPAEIRHYFKRLVWDEALHCYEEGTEILTTDGWKDFREISTDTLVAQFTEDKRIEWVYPQEVVCDYHDGELIHFSNQAIDSSVTPNHRVISYSEINGKHYVEPARTAITNNRYWPVAAFYGDTSTGLTAIERLMIAFQADGMAQYKTPVFRFKKQRKIDRLELLLNEAKISYRKIYRESDPEVCELRLASDSIPMHKRLSDWVDLRLFSYRKAYEFIDELLHWDGTRSKTNRYFTSAKYPHGHDNVSTIQAIAALGGYHARASYSGNMISLTFVKKPWVVPETVNKKTKQYKGNVYCVAVPSGMIVVRYNGKVLVSGNTRSYRYVIENLGIPLTIYDRWKEVPAMKARVEMAQEISAPLLKVMGWMYLNDEPMPQGTWIKSKQALLRSMIFWFLIFEGVWFWVNLLGPIQQLARLGRFKGAAEQFQYIARDEQSHIGFGHRLIQEFMAQYPECLTDQFLTTVVDDVKRAIQLEEDFSAYCLKDGPILGYSVPDHLATAKFFANMRLGSVGLPQPFADANHAFPWMSEQMELKKEKNFFETRVTDYMAGGALSFDEGGEGWFDPLADLRSA